MTTYAIDERVNVGDIEARYQVTPEEDGADIVLTMTLRNTKLTLNANAADLQTASDASTLVTSYGDVMLAIMERNRRDMLVSLGLDPETADRIIDKVTSLLEQEAAAERESENVDAGTPVIP